MTSDEGRDLERYLDVTRAEMLFARTVILVEGIAELYLLPAFATNQGVDLDAEGITVCSVHGTDFRPYWTFLNAQGLNVERIVVTDGDPSKAGDPLGLRRGLALIDSEPLRQQVNAAIESGQYDQARELLGGEGIYVGSRTLELDLIPTASPAMLTAYSELRSGDQARANFQRSLAASNDATSAAEVLRRIAALGKGRFAQRLAAHLAGVEPPPYLQLALTRAVNPTSSDASAQAEGGQ